LGRTGHFYFVLTSPSFRLLRNKAPPVGHPLAHRQPRCYAPDASRSSRTKPPPSST
jgi:hypothetical protein